MVPRIEVFRNLAKWYLWVGTALKESYTYQKVKCHEAILAVEEGDLVDEPLPAQAVLFVNCYLDERPGGLPERLAQYILVRPVIEGDDGETVQEDIERIIDANVAA